MQNDLGIIKERDWFLRKYSLFIECKLLRRLLYSELVNNVVDDIVDSSDVAHLKIGILS